MTQRDESRAPEPMETELIDSDYIRMLAERQRELQDAADVPESEPGPGWFWVVTAPIDWVIRKVVAACDVVQLRWRRRRGSRRA